MTTPLHPELVSIQRRLQVARSYGLSIRQLSQLTGVSFGSIQGILSGRTVAPRELTIARLEGGLGDLPTILTGRTVTSVADRPIWTADDLQNLAPPSGATAARLVYYATGTGTGYASTDWFDLRAESPLDALLRAGAQPESVARVVFDRA